MAAWPRAGGCRSASTKPSSVNSAASRAASRARHACSYSRSTRSSAGGRASDGSGESARARAGASTRSAAPTTTAAARNEVDGEAARTRASWRGGERARGYDSAPARAGQLGLARAGRRVAAVEALHRAAPARVVEHELVEAAAAVAIDGAAPERGGGVILGALAH